MALYDQIYIYIDQVCLVENTTVETSLEADIQDVLTINKGWSGITPSPITRTITASNVVPVSGVEVDFEKLMIDNTEVEIMLQEASSGNSCVTRGYITNVPRSAGVGATTTISFTFKGKGTAFA
jgi:hypothetical protein